MVKTWYSDDVYSFDKVQEVKNVIDTIAIAEIAIWKNYRKFLNICYSWLFSWRWISTNNPS